VQARGHDLHDDFVAASASMPEQTGPADDQLALVDALAQTAFLVMGVLTRIAAEYDVSLTQMRVFGILRDHRPRMAELADYLGLEKSTMSGLIGRAEARGMIERHPNPDDARATDVALTRAGRALAERAQADVVRALEPLTGRLGPADARRLARLLRAVLA
jgi:DNA-binding MarR family transcriptional regulator